MELVDIEDGIQPLEELEYIYNPVPDGNPWYHANDVYKKLHECPLVDAKPIVHAHWKDDCVCSSCGKFREDEDGHILISSDFNYCPFCGAAMDETPGIKIGSILNGFLGSQQILWVYNRTGEILWSGPARYVPEDIREKVILNFSMKMDSARVIVQ